ncbi:MAG: ribbon-helix-helix protein, CopG family [bacterium]
MRTVRLNITIPKDLASELEKLAGQRGRSQFIAAAIRQKIQEAKKAELDRLLEEGYGARAKESVEFAKEFEPADLEGWDEY